MASSFAHFRRVTPAVLIIDSDPSVRDVMAQLLHLEGFAPFTAATGHEALQYLRAGGPAQVILLDLRMPVLDGWTLSPSRRAPVVASMPVVVLTRTNGGDALDVAGSFPRPLDFPRVINFIRDVCSRT